MNKLGELLRTDSPADRPGYTGSFVYAADALRSCLVPADLRASLYQAMLMLPAACLTESSGPSDEPVLSLSLVDGFRRRDVFVNPANGQFAGDRCTIIEDTPVFKAGTVTNASTVTVGTVNEIGLVPTSA